MGNDGRIQRLIAGAFLSEVIQHLLFVSVMKNTEADLETHHFPTSSVHVGWPGFRDSSLCMEIYRDTPGSIMHM